MTHIFVQQFEANSVRCMGTYENNRLKTKKIRGGDSEGISLHVDEQRMIVKRRKVADGETKSSFVSLQYSIILNYSEVYGKQGTSNALLSNVLVVCQPTIIFIQTFSLSLALYVSSLFVYTYTKWGASDIY